MRMALVTGATGFVGSHLLEHLLAQDWRVRVLVRDSKRLIPQLAQKTEIFLGDLNDQALLKKAVYGVDAVFHCAAEVDTWAAMNDYIETNVNGVENLLEALVHLEGTPPRLVHLSSMDVYGFPLMPCTESDRLNGAGFAYGESKCAGEAKIAEYAALYSLPCVILRPGNIIGPRSQFIKRIGKELRSGLMLKINGGRVHAGVTSIQTLCEVMIWAAKDPKVLSRCYNVRDDGNITWDEFLTVFQEILGQKGFIINLPYVVAETLARGIQFLYRLAPTQEPLLHPLIVRIFGRTCGHSIAQLKSDSGLTLRSDFKELMRQSVEPLLEASPTP